MSKRKGTTRKAIARKTLDKKLNVEQPTLH